MKAGIIIFLVFMSMPLLTYAQGLKPIYLSFSSGRDLSREKSFRVLDSHPKSMSISLEKRLPQSEFYGLGIHFSRFVTEFSNYNHFSVRGYQHFGTINNISSGNIDPYLAGFMGIDAFQGNAQLALGALVGMRIMLHPCLGIHAEIGSSSSSHNNSAFVQFGMTSCIGSGTKLFSPKHRNTRCPKF